MKSLVLDLPENFSFEENRRYLQRSTNECLLTIQNDKIYRALAIGSTPLLVEISADRQTLTIRFLSPCQPECDEEILAVERYIRDWFDMDTNLEPFYELAQRDPLLKDPVSRFFGLRLMGIPDLFEALAWAIIGQQINLAFAYILKRRLVERFGTSIDWQGQKHWIFPKAENIATLEVDELTDLKMTVKKSEYLIDVARLIVNGEVSKEKLLASDFQSAEKTLLNIRGIGPWTANYVLMRCLRYREAFPIDDVGLQNALKAVLGKEKKPTKEEIRNYAVAWRNWESYATFYLWRILY